MTKDVEVAVVGVDSEPALRGSVPAVDYGADFEAPFTEPEGERFLFGAVAGVAFDIDSHANRARAPLRVIMAPLY